MTKFTLYYPLFAMPEGDPEETEFTCLKDLKKNKGIKRRMFGFFGLKNTYAVDLKPEYDKSENKYYKHVFHKDHAYRCTAIITADTAEEVTNALNMLGTVAVHSVDW